MWVLVLILAATTPRAAPTRPQTPPKDFNATVDGLAQQLTNGDARVRTTAEQELLAMGPPATEQLLATAVLTRNSEQKEAIRALLPKYGPAAIERMLWGPGWQVNVYRGDAGTDDPIRDLAVDAIVRMGVAALPEVRRLVEAGRPRGAMSVLNGMGPLATETVVDLLLHHPEDDMRTSMASMLGNNPSLDPRAADGLLQALRDKRAPVQMYATRGVGHLRDRRAIPRLLELLRTNNAEIQRSAASSLGKMYEPRLFGPLSRVAHWDSDWDVRQAASNVLIYWTFDPVAIRVGQRYYPPTMTVGVIDVAYTNYALLLVMSGMLVYLLIWSMRDTSRKQRLWKFPAGVALALLFGFAWAFWMIRVWALIEALLLVLVIPAAALLAWRTAGSLKSLRGSLIGCVLAFLLVFFGSWSGVWIQIGLWWLAPRLLVASVVISQLTGVLKKITLDPALVAPARRATLACAAAFYLGYGVGWLALWGYLGF